MINLTRTPTRESLRDLREGDVIRSSLSKDWYVTSNATAEFVEVARRITPGRIAEFLVNIDRVYVDSDGKPDLFGEQVTRKLFFESNSEDKSNRARYAQLDIRLRAVGI